MSESKGIRTASIFVGVLLCMALMQTAFAAWSIPDFNTTAGNETISNMTTSNVTTSNVTNSSVSPSDPTNISIPSSNPMNFSNLSAVMNFFKMKIPRIR
jgi:hypothetical protein